MPPYKDLADIPEDERIKHIGSQAMTGKVVGFMTDADDGKLDRYLVKLFMEFPQLELVGRGQGPVPGVVWAKVRMKL